MGILTKGRPWKVMGLVDIFDELRKTIENIESLEGAQGTQKLLK